MSLTPHELYGQFILHKNGAPVPEGWNASSFEGWTLAAHPRLPAHAIRLDGRHVGWLIGYAAGSNGALVDRAIDLPSLDQLESFIYGFGGRFACAIVSPQLARLYMDPCGSLAAVYAVDRSMVGSTSTLLSLGNPSYLARKLAQPTLPANQFYPAGISGDPEFARLLPNHYLDLNSWKPVRHWPTELAARDESQIAANVASVADHLRSTITAVAKRYHCYMGLTAGRDSRMVLAAARDAIDRFTFVTFRYKPGGYNKEKVVDLHIARKLSSKLGLMHIELDLRDPPREMKDEFQIRTGFAGHWGRVVDHYDAVSALDMSGVWLTGYAGEVGRAFYWGWGEDLKKSLTAEELLRRMHLQESRENLAATNRWLDSFPESVRRDYFALLDLLYIEQRLGCWASPAMYGGAPFAFTLTPFNHRGIFTAMMSLPSEYRARQELAADVVKHSWPAAMSYPFQQYTGLSALGKRVKEKLARLRKRIARP